ncbi:MAG: phenylacetate-CoA ligase [Thermoleophilaceae bacterium]|jgi:phenylacetate-CoA ligase|nr:phenylacetate-CoA ligase [Thermoleophilaceae bacterium]
MSATSDRAIWDAAETMPREALRALQLERLQATVARVLGAQPLGAVRLAGAGIGAIDSLEDLARLPFSWKSDLRDSYPFSMLTVPREQVVRLHASSGSHGKPTVVGYTRADLDAWAELMARCMTMAGVRPGMLVHNANGYGLFTGGFGFHDGAERIGATVIPVSGGFSARQAMLLSDLGGQVLVSTPSYALVIAQAVRDAGLDPAELRLELGLFGGEPFSEAMRDQIERELGLRAVGFYGLSEMCGPGVAAECPAREGLHVQEDHFLVEVVDPDSGEPVGEGQDGELVFTTLAKEALPLIRYRTGDIGSLESGPCACGRTFARIASLRGRRDDMLIVRGVNLFPSTVEHLLVGVDEVAPHYRLILEREGTMDELTVECEPASGEVDRSGLAARLEHLLREHTGLRIAVAVVEPGAVPRSEGKAVRVVDRRG